jgi:signal transduction histidine kinase
MSGTLGSDHNSVLESSSLAAWTLNSDLKFVYFNERLQQDFTSIFGVRPEIDKSIIDTFAKVDTALAEKWQKRFEQVSIKGFLTIEEIYLSNDFSRSIEFEIKCFKQTNGDFGIYTTANDISERKRFEQSLILDKNVIRSILDYTKSAVWLINHEKKLIEFNRAFISFYKLAFGSAMGISPNFVGEIREREERVKWVRHFDKVLNGQSATVVETMDFGGLEYAFKIECHPLSHNGFVRGAVFFAHDISEQYRQEITLRSKNQELQKVNSQLDKFVYSASHDLRAPITTAKGLINLIKLDPSTENVLKCVEMLNFSIDKLNLAIKEIGDFAYNARIQVKLEKIRLHGLIQDCIHECSHLPNFANVKFEVNAGYGDFVTSDVYRLKLVLVNLINNAIRFQDEQKNPCVVIRVSGRNNRTSSIEVIDNGIGIPPDHVEKIFEMFYKATPRNSGPGLGLYIAREAINLIGGTLKVHSEFGVGSRFKIDLDRRTDLE